MSGHWKTFWAKMVWLSLSPVLASSSMADTPMQLEIGMQKRYTVEQPIERVAIGDPAIADVTVINAREVLITPLAAGTTNMTIWPEQGTNIAQLTLQVAAAGHSAENNLNKLEAGSFSSQAVGGEIQLQGSIPSLEQHADVRQALGINDETGIDSSEITTPSQVQIDIKIVEVNRNRLLDYSAGFSFLKPNARRARSITSPGNAIPQGGALGNLPNTSDSDGFNFVFSRLKSNGEQILSVLSILEGNGFAYTLAEPSLMAMSGQSANFLAGGEFPVPVRGGGLDNSVTIEYKEFGVRLSLTPTVLDSNRIALKVAPEVSELDFNAGIESGGVTVPALRVRRTDTTVALGDGESFVISGLVSQNTLANVDKLPGIGDIPILGAFFRSNRFDRSETELLMIVTPRLVKPIARTAQLPELPGERYRNYDPNFAEFIFMESGRFGEQAPVNSGFSK
ncbi:MAG: type II and III secretion system protein family protein [Methylophaga sp.]